MLMHDVVLIELYIPQFRTVYGRQEDRQTKPDPLSNEPLRDVIG